MPRAGDLPAFAFSTHNVPATANPLSVKGLGEAGAVGAPAVINAIVDALHRRTGVSALLLHAMRCLSSHRFSSWNLGYKDAIAGRVQRDTRRCVEGVQGAHHGVQA
jgi:hypothetical protein